MNNDKLKRYCFAVYVSVIASFLAGCSDRQVMTDGKNASFYVGKGIDDENSGADFLAIQDYQTALIYDRDNIYALYNLGRIYLNKNDNRRAADNFTKVIERKPDAWDAYNNRSIAYARLGQKDLALKDLDYVLSENPSYLNAVFNRADFYDKNGQFEKSAADFSKYILLSPYEYVPYLRRGKVLAAAGRNQEALSDFKRVMKMCRYREETYTAAAAVCRKTGCESDAEGFERVLKTVKKEKSSRKRYPASPSDRMMFAINNNIPDAAQDAIYDGLNIMEPVVQMRKEWATSYFHIAAFFGRDKICRILLDAGDSPNRRDINGCTVFMSACKGNRFGTVMLLYENGADLSALDLSGKNALFMVAQANTDDTRVSEFLFSKMNFDINGRDKNGFTPLLESAFKNSSDKGLVPYFLSKGADLRAVNREGRGVLHLAAMGTTGKFMNYLISKGIPVDIRDASGRTPLMLAIIANNYFTVDSLISSNADISLTDTYGYTAIMYAAEGNSMSAAVSLLKKGANPAAVNSSGLSAISIAESKGFDKMKRILEGKETL
jgi:ankyrin repeat protein/Flp pilus assembly protein TadD